MKVRKKILIPIAFVVIIGGCLLLLFHSKPIVSTGDIKDNNVEVIKVIYQGEEITDEIDAQKLVKTLTSYKCRWIFANEMPEYLKSDSTWEISLLDHQKSSHIILGDVNIRYEAVGHNVNKIMSPDELMDDLKKIL
jgi:hypothetical protein